MIYQAGIYHIRNTMTGRFYIGRTGCIYHRWIAHRSELNRGKHKNRELQKDWNNFGEECFEFVLVLETNNYLETQRLEREAILAAMKKNGKLLYNAHLVNDYSKGR